MVLPHGKQRTGPARAAAVEKRWVNPGFRGLPELGFTDRYIVTEAPNDAVGADAVVLLHHANGIVPGNLALPDQLTDMARPKPNL